MKKFINFFNTKEILLYQLDLSWKSRNRNSNLKDFFNRIYKKILSHQDNQDRSQNESQWNIFNLVYIHDRFKVLAFLCDKLTTYTFWKMSKFGPRKLQESLQG